MTVYVFVGPTLPVADARRHLDAIYLPPASQGDVYRVSLKNPDAIGIIDGVFQHVPSVWHKEILWALHQGIPLFGSASMGALRAAELHIFGMRGVGKIFEAYRDGLLEDDDEVAVATAPADQQFAPLSEAMVNIRYSLEAAEEAGVLTSDVRLTLVEIIKTVPFPLRNYQYLLQLARNSGVSSQDLEFLRDWLSEERRDLKRDDALAMLEVMRTHLVSEPPPPISFNFEHTEFFERFRRTADEHLEDLEDSEFGSVCRVSIEDQLNELRLDPEQYFAVRHAALLRCLSLREAQRVTAQISADELDSVVDEFRRCRGLHGADETRLWMSLNDLTPNQFRSLLKEEVLLGRIEVLMETEVSANMRNALRVDGHYHALAARAHNKTRVLDSAGLHQTTVVDGLSTNDILDWYFTKRLGAARPKDTSRHARNVGFPDESTFVAAVQREYWYTRLTDGKQAANTTDLL